jgi:hypothetical protein
LRQVDHDQCWLLLYTKARAESWADINLRKQGFTTLLPRVRQRGGFAPLFPRYLFVGAREPDNRVLAGPRRGDAAPGRYQGLTKVFRFPCSGLSGAWRALREPGAMPKGGAMNKLIIGLAALVQVSATMPMNYIAFEYPTGQPEWWHDIVEGLPDPIVVNGQIEVWDRPGMGVDLIPEEAKKYLREEDQDFFD